MTNYLRGLDTLRAIAALVVVFVHVEYLKKTESIPNLIDNDFFIFPSGHIAVILFFVLSGFIITYTLVKEREKFKQIHLKNFYMRRVLRIWPLYFTTIFLSYILFDNEYSTSTIILCLMIFPNIAHAFVDGWTSSPQIWSIGVEEQFYLIWPIVLIMLPEKKVIKFLIAFIIIYTFLPPLFNLINEKTFQNQKAILVLNNFFYLTKFNCMAVGGLMGYALAKEKRSLEIFKNQYFVILTIVLSIGLWFFKFEFIHLNYLLYSILFSMMIVGLSINKQNFIDTKITSFLGKISYGIYMYHWIITLIVMKYLNFNGDQIYYNSILYCSVFIITIFISWISHNTLERYFLNFKKNYSTKNI